MARSYLRHRAPAGAGPAGMAMSYLWHGAGRLAWQGATSGTERRQAWARCGAQAPRRQGQAQRPTYQGKLRPSHLTPPPLASLDTLHYSTHHLSLSRTPPTATCSTRGARQPQAGQGQPPTRHATERLGDCPLVKSSVIRTILV
jgi:hypothetical protein